LLTTFQATTKLFGMRRSPDGQRIITASYDQTVRIWRVLTLDDIEQILSKWTSQEFALKEISRTIVRPFVFSNQIQLRSA